MFLSSVKLHPQLLQYNLLNYKERNIVKSRNSTTKKTSLIINFSKLF